MDDDMISTEGVEVGWARADHGEQVDFWVYL